jgi:hypothetical protein
VTGGNAFQVFAEKVRYGAKLLYNTFGDKKTEGDGASTLNPDDLKPAWHDPAKRDGAA